jgi:hypothetical protein
LNSKSSQAMWLISIKVISGVHTFCTGITPPLAHNLLLHHYSCGFIWLADSVKREWEKYKASKNYLCSYFNSKSFINWQHEATKEAGNGLPAGLAFMSWEKSTRFRGTTISQVYYSTQNIWPLSTIEYSDDIYMNFY